MGFKCDWDLGEPPSSNSSEVTVVGKKYSSDVLILIVMKQFSGVDTVVLKMYVVQK